MGFVDRIEQVTEAKWYKLDGTMKKLEEFLKRRCICQRMKD